MEMIFFVNLLAASIFMVPFMNCIESSCFTKCGTETSCLNSKLPIIRGLNLAATCNQESTCFGRSDATFISIQQVSETLIEGQNLYLNVSNLLSNNFTFRVFNATNEDIFNSCNFENSTEIFYSYVNSSYLFEMPKLTIGTHYFIFDSSNNLFECNFGLRLQVFVYEDNCSIDNLLCSSNGQCAINKTAKSFNCLCCDSPYTGQYCSTYNYCHNHTCTNNATCVSDNNALNNTGYKCLCLMQFTGMFCENCVNGYIGKFCNTDINECQENATLCNYGNCTNFNESFSCQCFVNVTGKYCETDLYDNCVESKCSNVSTCIDKYGSYMCDCYPGYEGEFCDEEVDECIGNKCSVDGTEKCVDKFRGYSCQCRSGFTGELCDSITDACHPEPCQNGALCIAEIDSYKCICQAGFVGKNCSEVANKCLVLNPCENSGQCIRTGNNLRDYLCICPSGWTGKNCSTELKRCDSNPCLNNFTCIDSFDNFTCVCNSSWTGRYCESNINGCLSSPCVNNSQCIDLATDSDYSCICPVGFTSKNCDRNINDCENISCNNGKCIDEINNFHCECNNSWFGEFCDTNRDLCSASPCFQSQLCKNINTTQGFICFCEPGFTGSNCNINIDDCVNQTCKNGGSCNDYINFANCTCAPGYIGSHCEIEINECESNPCLNNGTCLDFIGSFFCKCQPGFNGSICENNIDDCISQPCANNGSCFDEINDFSCNCSAGFLQKTCMTHKCDIKSTCVNNGTCLKTKQQPGYECQCLSGFTGKDCNSTVNQCASSPCLHNATCINKITSFECQCPFPFAGETCNDHICVHQPCQNNGTCIELPNDYSCICTAGFTNTNCSTNINGCSNNSCNSNNTEECIDLVNKYQCSCYEGFYGQFCNQTKCSIDNICNNGTCVMNNTSFYCNCYAGYAGEFCTENMNDCQNISCGTGVCIDEINGFSCQCPILKSGKYCEIDLDFCSSSPCLNNATCVNKPQNNTYQCICEPPFYGEHCDQHPCNQTDVCNNGTCISQQKNFSCQCFDGFSGKYCDHVIDLCRNVSCLNKGECVSSLNNFTCQCTQNFTGKYCETIIDYCHENKCSNVSNCVSNFVNRNYTCDCKPGYYGRFCEKNECQMLNPCRNGSTCFVSPTNGTICSCLPGFTSKYCSELIDNCESQPCLNNATCANGINSYKCQCKAGFTGNRCETFTGACSKRNCLNRGECIGNLTSSYCQCQHGFYGDLCERFSCPCQNNGRCFRFNSTSPIQCICSTNYTGSLCETFKGDCRSLNPPCTFESFCQLLPNGYACNCPQHLQGESCNVSGVCQDSTCKNNGICTSISTNRFSCSCKPGFTGSQCQFDMNECASNPCQNSGVCIEEGYGEAKCICLKSFHGNFCENAQESTVDTHSMMLHSTLGRSKKIMITSILQASPSQSLSMMTSYGAVTTPVTSYHLLSKSHKLQSTMMSFKYSTISTSHLTKSFYSSAQRFSTMTSIIIYTSSAEQIIAPTTSMQSIISSMHNTLKLVTPSTSSLSTVSRVSSTAATTIMTTTTRPYLNISCSDSPCNGFMCVNQSDNGLNFRCECLFPYYGPVCSNDTVLRIARFNGRSYVIFPQILLNQTVNTIVISFHTDQNNGLLFHASNDLRKDFITGKVKDRFFEVSMSFGSSEIITLKSGSEVATGNLVIASISINSNTRIVLLEVNRSDTVSKYISSTFQQIDLNNNWYFGGIPGYVKANFTGCIKDFQVNNKTIKLTDKSSVITWFGVSECDISACSRGACLNSAQCIPDHKNLDHFQCECKEGYFGKTCKDRNEYCKNTSCNGGSCVWTPSKSECLCQYGKTGVDCLNETLISMPRFSVVNNYSSYMEYPWLQTGRNAIDRFEIRFQFKVSSNSSNNDGLMVYIGQSTIGADTDDYLAIGIYQDYVILIYNLGSGTVVLQSRDKIPGNRTWHFLLIGRTLQQGYIYLNSQSKLSSRSPGIFTGLDVFTPLYVGGVPDFSNLPPVLKPYFNKGFSGVIYDTAIRTNSQSFVPLLTLKSSQASKNVIGIPVESGLNIVNDVKDYCASNPCANNGTCESSGWSFVCKCVAPYKPPNCHSTNALCVDYNPCSVKSSCRVDGFDVKCDCPFGYSGIFCTEKLSIEIPFFNMNSFISMIGVKVYSQAIISIQFKTTREYGLLFYTAHRLNEDSGDFFAISLWKRYIYVKFNLGSHTISMRTRNRVTLSKQHSLYVHQQGREAIMQLDDMTPPVGVAGSSTMTKLDVSQYFYVGGVPDMFLINKFATKDFVMQSGFSGCISQLTVNGKSFVLNSTNALLTGRNVQNCRALPCNECLNNAICHAQSSGTTNCTCALGFVGEYCEKDVLNMTSAYFNETSFWYTRREGLDSTSMGYSFDFKTSTISDSPQMIFWHGAIGDANDFLTVGIENGFLNITFAVKGVTSSKLSTTKYNDEKFHKLQIQRVDTTLLIFVDASSPQFIEISSSNIQSKSYGYIYLGGFPEKTRQYSGNRYTSGFIGCISNVELTPTSNDKMIIINFAEKQMAKGYGLRLCN